MIQSHDYFTHCIQYGHEDSLHKPNGGHNYLYLLWLCREWWSRISYTIIVFITFTISNLLFIVNSFKIIYHMQHVDVSLTKDDILISYGSPLCVEVSLTKDDILISYGTPLCVEVCAIFRGGVVFPRRSVTWKAYNTVIVSGIIIKHLV